MTNFSIDRRIRKIPDHLRKIVLNNGFLLFLVFILAFFLRTYKLYSDYLFEGNDAPFFILFAMGLTKSENIIVFLTQILNYQWGIMQPLFLLVNITILNLFKIKFTEYSLTFGTALLGSVGVFLIYKLTSLFRKRAALIASLFVALFTLHVGMSRNVIGSDHVAADLMMVLIISLFYVYCINGKYPWLISILLSAYTLSTGTFLGIYPLIIFIAIVANIKNFRFDGRGFIRVFLNYRVIALPILTLIFLITTYGLSSYLGVKGIGYIGHIFNRASEPGFYLFQLLSYFSANTGKIFAIYLLFGFLYGLKKLLRLEKESIFTVWALIYLLPFAFLVSPEVTVVRGYLGRGTLPLIILASIMTVDLHDYLNSVMRKLYSRMITTCIILLVMSSALANTVNVVFQTDNDTDKFYGSMSINTGTKTAGYFIREIRETRIEPEIIFTDLGIEAMRYYAGNSVIGEKNAAAQEKVNFFRLNKERIDYVIISAKNIPYFQEALNGFYESAQIYSKEKHILSIYSKNKQDSEKLETEKVDRLFDDKYGNLYSIRLNIFGQLLDDPKYEVMINKAKSIPIIGYAFKDAWQTW
ncbi:hypothetical protein J4206_04110 [Candidatus Woesearchaeota archaeon]|nr:hypothetical protein [Candidatus Woesearchaeota archaeon]